MYLLNICGSREFGAGEVHERSQNHSGHSDDAFGVFLHRADRFVYIGIYNKPSFGAERDKEKHMTTGKRRDQCFLGVDRVFNRQW